MARQSVNTTDKHYPPFQLTERDKENDGDDDYTSLPWFHDEILHHCHVRVQLDDEELVLFLVSCAKIDVRMPALEEFAIWAPVSFGYLEALPELDGFYYTAVSKYAGPKPSEAGLGYCVCCSWRTRLYSGSERG